MSVLVAPHFSGGNFLSCKSRFSVQNGFFGSQIGIFRAKPLGKNRVFPLISAHFRSYPLILAVLCAGAGGRKTCFSAHFRSNGTICMSGAHAFYYLEVKVTGCCLGWQGAGVSGAMARLLSERRFDWHWCTGLEMDSTA